MTNLKNLSLKELREGLDKKDFSAKDLTENSLKEIEKNKDLNAFISVFADNALSQANIADKIIAEGKAKSLTGIPISVKDNILFKDYLTTCASKFLANFVPPYNATVTNKLLENNAVIVGKTNLDEFAMGSSTENSSYGNVLNPWNKTKVPGGSSGGSASAVAAGLTRAALGTDTGGSIRQPAAYCGISGMKPTYGRVSRYGVIAYASSLDQVGPLARSVEDLAIMTNVLAGKDSLDSTSLDKEVPDFTKNLGQEIKGLRVGVPKEYFIDGVDKEVKEKVLDAIKIFENSGAEIIEISLPHTKFAVPCYYIIAPAEASSNLSRYDGIRYGVRADDYDSLIDLYCNSRSEGFGDEVKRRIMVGTYVLSSGYYDAYYLKAQKVRRLIKDDFTNVFDSQCDVIISPTAPTTAFGLNEKTDDPVKMYLNDIFTIPVNLAGLPAMSIPCGFDSSKLPIGLQLIGRPWDEETLFKAGYAYQQNTSWHNENAF